MNISHHTRVLLTMTAQVVLSALFVGGYFLLMYQFLIGNVHVPEAYKDAFITLLGVLTAGVGLILSFWFQRQRPQESPAPGTQA
jgi:protein-S-isoprenylcysteine O-methyltransferase Ste14